MNDMNDQTEELLEIDEAAAERGRRVTLVVTGLFVLACAVGLTIRYWPQSEARSTVVPLATAPRTDDVVAGVAPSVTFTDVTESAGIRFRHFNGARGRKLLPETMGTGCAFIDYDRDGDQDLLLVNSAPWPGDETSPAPTQAFFRNDGGTFVDITQEVGLAITCYGMGASVGDFDDDGWPDLFITAVGPNRLLRNVEGKRFVDVATEAGVTGGESWSTSSAFLDYDRDGRLDLFVLAYVTWTPEIDLEQGFSLVGLGRAYGPPTGFEGESCHLYRNLGGGRFEDASEKAGVVVRNRATGVLAAKSLGVTVCDFNEDGLPDLLVANDTVSNFAFRNRGDGTFTEVGSEIGIAFDDKGNARGAMGVATADFRNDGSLAVAIGNFANEMTAFYINEDPSYPSFLDEATTVGVGAATRDSLTFGVAFLDYDLDGRMDFVAANGHVEPDIQQVQASQRHAQPVELFWNAGREFVQVDAAKAGADLFRPLVGRSVACADVDGDGDLDLLLTANAGSPRLFRNDQTAHRSLRLDLRTRASRRAARGAAVSIRTPDGVQRRYFGGADGYLSQGELLLTFGLGQHGAARDVRIVWPDGTEQRIDRLAAGLHVIDQPSR